MSGVWHSGDYLWDRQCVENLLSTEDYNELLRKGVAGGTGFRVEIIPDDDEDC
jgi:hypothetical protein